MCKDFILPKINGERILVNIDTSKIYNVKENFFREMYFDKNFPYIHFRKHKYVKFRVQDTYETLKDFGDSRYKVDMGIMTFCEMFGFDCTSPEEYKMKTMVKYGEE